MLSRLFTSSGRRDDIAKNFFKNLLTPARQPTIILSRHPLKHWRNSYSIGMNLEDNLKKPEPSRKLQTFYHAVHTTYPLKFLLRITAAVVPFYRASGSPPHFPSFRRKTKNASKNILKKFLTRPEETCIIPSCRPMRMSSIWTHLNLQNQASVDSSTRCLNNI